MVNRSDIARLISSPESLSRAEIIIAVTDLFLEEKEPPSEPETARFSEIVATVIDKMAGDLRREISTRVSASDRITRTLAQKLAQADIAVAAPVLAHSPLLDDEDLVRATREQTMEHRLAISRRATLSERVTDALTEVGEDAVLESVAGNTGAAFSPLGFRQLVERGGGHAGVQSALSRRASGDARFGASLHGALSAELRARLGAAFDAVPDARLASALDIATLEAEEAIRERMRERVELKVLIKDLNAQKTDVDTAFDMLAHAGRLDDLGLLCAELLHLPESVPATALRKADPTSLAFLCKALSLKPSTYAAVLTARDRRFGGACTDRARRMADYGAIQMSAAQRAIRVLKLQRSSAL